MRIIKHSAFLLIVLIQISMGFVTLYGVSKSFIEYFCVQKRGDDPDYVNVNSWRSVNITSGNYLKNSNKGVDYSLLSVDGELRMYKRKVTDEEIPYKKDDVTLAAYREYVLLDEYSEKYTLNKSYFSIRCYPQKWIPVNVRDNNVTGFYKMNYDWKQMMFNEQGYTYEVTPFTYYKLGEGNHTLSYVTCELKKSPETCSIKIETTNLFFVFYILSIVLSILSFCLVIWGFKDSLGLRIYHSISDYFSEVSRLERFCNPITGRSHFIKSDETVVKLSNELQATVISGKLSFMEDLKGKYIVDERGVHLMGSFKEKYIEMNKSQRDEISFYFFLINSDPLKCVMNEEENHFLETASVIKSISEGKYLSFSRKREEGHVQKIHHFEYLLISKYISEKKGVIKAMLEHNWLFFGEKYNIEALLSCIKGKMYSTDAPENVNNSQWKYYTSDFVRLTKDWGYNYKSQCKWGPSKALKSVQLIDFNKVEVEKPITLEIKEKTGIEVNEVIKTLSSVCCQEVEKNELVWNSLRTKRTEEVEEYYKAAGLFIKEVNELILSEPDWKKIATEAEKDKQKEKIVECAENRVKDLLKVFDNKAQDLAKEIRTSQPGYVHPCTKDFKQKFLNQKLLISGMLSRVQFCTKSFEIIENQKKEQENGGELKTVAKLRESELADKIINSSKGRRRVVRQRKKGKNLRNFESKKIKMNPFKYYVKKGMISENFRSSAQAAALHSLKIPNRRRTVYMLRSSFFKKHIGESKWAKEYKPRLMAEHRVMVRALNQDKQYLIQELEKYKDCEGYQDFIIMTHYFD